MILIMSLKYNNFKIITYKYEIYENLLYRNGFTNNFQNMYYISLLIFRKKGKYRRYKQVMLHCVKLSISIVENLYLHKSQGKINTLK